MGKLSEQSPIPGHGFAVAAQFDAFEVFRETIGGWDLDFRQMDRGGFEARLKQVATPSVILTRCGLNRKVEQCGSSPAGYRTFGIPAADRVELRWRSRSLGGTNLMLFPPGGELESVSMPGFDVFTVSVSGTLLGEAADRRGLASLDLLFSGTNAIDYPAEWRHALRRKAGALAAVGGARPELLGSPAFRCELEHDLVECLLDAVCAGRSSGRRPMARRRSRVLKQALEAIADRAHEPLTVRELQHLVDASTRTLRNAFEEEFGVSPKQYLQGYRLNHVHRLLNRPLETTSVSDAANAWGFWHMGQFAADYRKMFGELPSETLGRKLRR